MSTLTIDNVTYTLNSVDSTASAAKKDTDITDATILDTVTDENGTVYTVTSISGGAFSGCSALTAVIIGANVTTIDFGAFYKCSALTAVTIPNAVTTIGDITFQECFELTAVIIGASVTSIGSGAFYSCSKLTAVIIGANVTSIGDSAFYSCSKLTAVIIPDAVTTIGEVAFHSCSALTAVIIGANVTSIGVSAFYSCFELTAVIIPDAVTSIGGGAFHLCSKLNAVTIGASVTSIGTGAFQWCTSLISIPVSSTNTVLYNDPSDNGVIYQKSNGVASLYLSVPTKVSYEMLSTIETVNVTSVHSHAFYFDASLSHIVLSDSITQIGESAFQDCKGLSNVVIPANVTTIDTRAFVSDSSLASVYFLGAKPSSIGEYAFSDINGSSTAYYLISNAISWGSTPSGFTNLATFTISDLRVAGYTASELQTLGVSDSDILGAGYNATQLTDAGYTETQLTEAGYTITTPTPSSNVCFPAKTPIMTNQGPINIEDIDPAVHTIRNKKIVAITKTVAHDKNLVRIAKHALGHLYPEKPTLISQNHKVFFQGQMVKAKHLVDEARGVTLVPYNGQVLYNVLLEQYEKMQVNNLIVETLHPEHKVAKLYRFLQNVDAAHHGKLIALFNKKDKEHRIHF